MLLVPCLREKSANNSVFGAVGRPKSFDPALTRTTYVSHRREEICDATPCGSPEGCHTALRDGLSTLRFLPAA
jgi:hypothetical protein